MTHLIYTLTIQCVRGPNLFEPFQRIVEVPSDCSLGDMHWMILDLVNFDGDDHLTGFFLARIWEGPKTWLLDDRDEPPWERRLVEIFPLPPRQSLFFLYDFGNSWIFEIRKDKLPDLVDGADELGLKCHDHVSMIPTEATSGSLPLEIKSSLQAHVPLEEALG